MWGCFIVVRCHGLVDERQQKKQRSSEDSVAEQPEPDGTLQCTDVGNLSLVPLHGVIAYLCGDLAIGLLYFAIAVTAVLVSGVKASADLLQPVLD